MIRRRLIPALTEERCRFGRGHYACRLAAEMHGAPIKGRHKAIEPILNRQRPHRINRLLMRSPGGTKDGDADDVRLAANRKAFSRLGTIQEVRPEVAHAFDLTAVGLNRGIGS